MSIPRSIVSIAVLLLTPSLLLFGPKTTANENSPGFANLEPAPTNPVRLSADGTRLFAVNTPNNSLSVFDVTQPTKPVLMVEIPVGVGPVSVNPVNDDQAWVVNQVSNSVSIASVTAGIVTNTIYTGAGTEPMDVVFAGGNQAYVSYSRTNAIGVFDTASLNSIATIPVFGGNPRALAVSADGSLVYAAFAISGNATTIIPDNLAPPPPPPLNKNLPPPPQVGLIVAATDPKWQSYITFTMPDNDVVAISTGSTPAVAGYYSGVGTINLGMAVNPVTGDLFVANTNARNLTFFTPVLRGHWVDNQITQIQISTGAITPYNLNPNIDYKILPNPAALKNALAQPAGVVFDPSGNFMYVAAFGTDRVAEVDTSGKVLGFVEVSGANGSGGNADPKHKRGPRGLALNASAEILYSLNEISNTITVIDAAKLAKVTEIATGTDPTPTEIKQGRGFLYDAKLSGNGTGACSSCHVDADMDHLAWNMGDRDGVMSHIIEQGKQINFHPMKGPMVTKTLRGVDHTLPLTWRGDTADLAAFNAVFDKLMGSAELSAADMATFTNFLNSILYLPNPYENLDRTLPTSLAGGNPQAGLSDYSTVQGSGTPGKTCNFCHTANPGIGSDGRVIILPQQPMKDAQLRNIYQKLLYTRHNAESIDGFGMEHDGNISIPSDLLDQPTFHYTQQQKTDITSYLLCFDTGTAPAVGFTVTLNKNNVNYKNNQTGWATLESQAAVPNIDLEARGTIGGQVIGLLYQPSTSNYLSDTGTSYTHAQLQGFIQQGDTLSFMGVYPGTGTTH
ncbi:MAG TPA: beta-propeller fold lactonase family protein [Terriglobales bacterium]